MKTTRLDAFHRLENLNVELDETNYSIAYIPTGIFRLSKYLHEKFLVVKLIHRHLRRIFWALDNDK